MTLAAVESLDQLSSSNFAGWRVALLVVGSRQMWRSLPEAVAAEAKLAEYFPVDPWAGSEIVAEQTVAAGVVESTELQFVVDTGCLYFAARLPKI